MRLEPQLVVVPLLVVVLVPVPVPVLLLVPLPLLVLLPLLVVLLLPPFRWWSWWSSVGVVKERGSRCGCVSNPRA